MATRIVKAEKIKLEFLEQDIEFFNPNGVNTKAMATPSQIDHAYRTDVLFREYVNKLRGKILVLDKTNKEGIAYYKVPYGWDPETEPKTKTIEIECTCVYVAFIDGKETDMPNLRY